MYFLCFVVVTEESSRKQSRFLHVIRKGKVKVHVHEEFFMPETPRQYKYFKTKKTRC